MSYAEEFFGVREMEALTLADNLAWFGTDSYVYKSQDLMNKVIDSTQARLNPIVNLYIYLYTRDNELNANATLPIGSEIAIYNSDFNESFNFRRISSESDGSSVFVMSNSLFFIKPLDFSSANIPNDITTYSQYLWCRWCNSDDINNVAVWTNKPESMSNTSLDTTTVLKSMPGFLHGIESDVKEKLKDIESGWKCLPLTEKYAKTICELDDASTIAKQMLRYSSEVKKRTKKYVISRYLNETLINSSNNINDESVRYMWIPLTLSSDEAASITATDGSRGTLTGTPIYYRLPTEKGTIASGNSQSSFTPILRF